jgi:hypothetical protein
MTTQLHTQVMLASGEMLTAAEIFEGFVRLAQQASPFPMLARDDLVKACVNLTFEAVERFDEGGLG